LTAKSGQIKKVTNLLGSCGYIEKKVLSITFEKYQDEKTFIQQKSNSIENKIQLLNKSSPVKNHLPDSVRDFYYDFMLNL